MFDRCSGDPKTFPADEPWLERSLLIARWRAIREDVLLHKWYESERAGHDIGWDRAFVDWTLRVSADFCRRFPPPS